MSRDPRPARTAVLALPDGRRLAYEDLGKCDGEPVLYCHGFPSSGREAELLDPVARARGARLLSPDRPGYGDSDPATGRRIADFARDCEVLLDRLGIARVRVIGVSGGAPYALACASRLGERVISGSLVCPLGPIHMPELLAQMAWPSRASFQLTRSAPALAHALFAAPWMDLASGLSDTLGHLRRLGSAPADREALTPDHRRILDDTLRDALARGAPGAREDLVLYTADWGLDLEAIRAPFDIWQGESDLIVPPAHARWYAGRLPAARLHLLPGEGHYSLPIRHADPILDALLAPATPGA